MRKTLALILALALALTAMIGLVSCGDGENPEGGAKVKTINVKLTDESYAFVCKKGNTELVDSFNAFLADYQG